MKAAINALVYVLIFAIAFIGIFMALPWAMKQMSSSVEHGEISVVKKDFLECAKRVIEAARTGSTEKCVFAANKGDLFVRTEGIYYRLTSTSKICDPHPWRVLERTNTVWSRCLLKGGVYVFELRWFYPKNDTVVLEGSVSIETPSGKRNYTLIGKGSLNVIFESPEGIKGKTIEIRRKLLTKDHAILSVKIE